MKFCTNELVSLSRLPTALWTSIHGGREHFDNPGSSLMSYCLSRIGNEFIEVPDELHESIQQCKEFSTSGQSITLIIETLLGKASSLRNKLIVLDEFSQKALQLESNEEIRSNKEVKRLSAAFITNGKMANRLFELAPGYLLFIQSLLEFKWAIDNLEYQLQLKTESGKTR